MAASEERELPLGQYEVAVAIAPAVKSPHGNSIPGGPDAPPQPGFDDTAGFSLPGRHVAQAMLAKGDAAVKLATESVARQIGVAATRIAAAIEAQGAPSGPSGTLSLESVEVSFGVTVAAGVEALFTAREESSVLVTVVLSRRP